jgi:hypothetical protein
MRSSTRHARQGNSGGGVFDPAGRCLLGVVSSGGERGANYVVNEVIAA